MAKTFSFPNIMGTLAFGAGFGFGIYAGVKNFNTEHQSKEMLESTRIFAELLQQAGNALVQGLTLGIATSLLLMCGMIGSYCKEFSEKQESDLIPEDTEVSPLTSKGLTA